MCRPADLSLSMLIAFSLAGCGPMVPILVPQAPPVPETRYLLAQIDGSRGVAAWRPRAIEHAMALDGQTCAFVDLELRCVPPSTLPPALVSSPRVLGAWQRYCDRGRGMAVTDWWVVSTTPRPADLKGACTPPRTAWAIAKGEGAGRDLFLTAGEP